MVTANSEVEEKDEVLRKYHERCLELMGGFKEVKITHVSRGQNVEANNLAQAASGYWPVSEKIVADIEAEDWRAGLIEYLKDPFQKTSKKLRYKAMKYVLLDDRLYYRTIEGILIKCLNQEEAKVVMCEVHEGICGTHQSAYRMKWLLR